MKMENISNVRWGVSILKRMCNSSGNCEWSYKKYRESRLKTEIISKIKIFG